MIDLLTAPNGDASFKHSRIAVKAAKENLKEDTSVLLQGEYDDIFPEGWPAIIDEQEVNAFVQWFDKTVRIARSTGKVALRFARAALALVGDGSEEFGQIQRDGIAKLSDIIVKYHRSFPTKLWSDFVKNYLDSPAVIRFVLTGCVRSTEQFLKANIKKVMQNHRALLNRTPDNQVMVFGFSETLVSALEGLVSNDCPLKIIVPRYYIAPFDFSAGEVLQRQFEGQGGVTVEVLENEEALQRLETDRSITLLLLGCKIVGMDNARSLQVVSSFLAQRFVRVAQRKGVDVGVISGMYKFWPQKKFVQYEKEIREEVVKSDSENFQMNDIIPGNDIKWFLTENGMFCQEELRSKYEICFFQPEAIPIASILAYLDSAEKKESTEPRLLVEQRPLIEKVIAGLNLFATLPTVDFDNHLVRQVSELTVLPEASVGRILAKSKPLKVKGSSLVTDCIYRDLSALRCFNGSQMRPFTLKELADALFLSEREADDFVKIYSPELIEEILPSQGSNQWRYRFRPLTAATYDASDIAKPLPGNDSPMTDPRRPSSDTLFLILEDLLDSRKEFRLSLLDNQKNIQRSLEKIETLENQVFGQNQRLTETNQKLNETNQKILEAIKEADHNQTAGNEKLRLELRDGIDKLRFELRSEIEKFHLELTREIKDLRRENLAESAQLRESIGKVPSKGFIISWLSIVLPIVVTLVSIFIADKLARLNQGPSSPPATQSQPQVPSPQVVQPQAQPTPSSAPSVP